MDTKKFKNKIQPTVFIWCIVEDFMVI